MPNTTASGRWCPIDRVDLGGQFQYIWQHCVSGLLRQSLNADDLTMGCQAENPHCMGSEEPDRPSGELGLDSAIGEPVQILGGPIGGDLSLRTFVPSSIGKIQSDGTAVAQVPDTNEFVRIFRFKVAATAAAGQPTPPASYFNIGVPIGEAEWNANPDQRVQVSTATSMHGAQPYYFLLKDPETGLAIPVFRKAE